MNKIIQKPNCFLVLVVCLLILPISPLYAKTISQELPSTSLGKIYLGIFGGGGAATGDTLSQQGTAFYSAGSGGPLAVDAFGEATLRTPWFVGAHIGYQLPGNFFDTNTLKWNLSPAAEFEGYYLNSAATGNDINNETSRLEEHDFSLNYPMNIRVFLINGVLNLNYLNYQRIHPYVGLGFGTALVSVAGATSTQTSPYEPGINHYNSEPSDLVTTFAAQPKVGLRFDLTKHISVFAEYRFLYIATTNFTFGSTVYSTHVATSNWTVRMGPNYYNLGAVGLEYAL